MNEREARELLHLPVDATRKRGYNRYRYLLKKHHPDKGGSTELTQQIIEAWDILKDILPKNPLIVFMVYEDDPELFLRFVRCSTGIHGDWIEYKKVNGAFQIVSEQPNLKFYEFQDSDNIVCPTTNTIEVVNQVENMKYVGVALWVRPFIEG